MIVIGLPAVQKATPPPLRASDPKHVTCLLKPNVALPVEGAPLVFSTSFAHDLTLHRDHTPGSKNLPLLPDAFQGGLVIHAAPEDRPQLPMPSDSGKPGETVTATPASAGGSQTGASTVTGSAIGKPGIEPVEQMATVNGLWGFDHFDGPTLPVQTRPGK